MNKLIDKRLMIILSGVLMSRILSTSVISHAENNEEVSSELSIQHVNVINTIKKGKVTASSLNVRAGASSNSYKIGSLKKGAIIDIESVSSSGWYKIKYGNRHGYVSGQYIEVLNNSNDSSTVATVIKKGKINTNTLNVRSSASTNSSKLGTLSKGAIVEVVKVEKNGWYKIKYKKGYGYVSSSYVVDVNSNDNTNNDSSTVPTVIKKGKINTDTLNVRSSASTNSSKLGTLLKDTVVEIVKVEKNGWYKIKYKKGYGYVSSSYVVDVNSNDNTNNDSSSGATVIKKGKINTDTLNVRSDASASSSKLGTLSKGTVVEIVKIDKNGWYKIKYKKGYGYVSGQYVMDLNDSSSGTTVIKKGKINTNTLNVRSSASTNSSKLGTLSKGTIVEIVKVEKDGWYKIKYKNGYGYISSSYVVDVNSSGESDRGYKNPAGYIQLKDKISVSGAGKNLVKGTMGLRVAKVQRKLGMGRVWEIVGPNTMTKVTEFQKKNGLKATGVVDLATWKKMGFSESSWYSLDSYVTPVKTNSKSTRSDLVEQMISTAQSYLGTEYVVGAAGPPGSGIDCSGLVMQSMYSIGIDPAPQRGDLVFYKNSAGQVIHVAIYLGNNRVIESWPEKVVNWPLIHPERALIKGYKRILG
ncbi:SH3 domain-containing protein [Terrisporobacter petrolearius]|uniref:SH3 domain-containing protein n=1 Tax=Terrisporobacter petrolearius TaxID=1460447 RepID=UPI0031CCA667